jgi:hypothetical protein
MVRLRKIISGGQTGVDRAALDAAIELGMEHGGWCPLGRLAEDGFIPVRYALRQTISPQYAVRTEQNVLSADGTIIFYREILRGGTELTLRFCRLHQRPYYLCDLTQKFEPLVVIDWLAAWRIEILNVAGPRERTSPGIGEACRALMLQLLQRILLSG